MLSPHNRYNYMCAVRQLCAIYQRFNSTSVQVLAVCLRAAGLSSMSIIMLSRHMCSVLIGGARCYAFFALFGGFVRSASL